MLKRILIELGDIGLNSHQIASELIDLSKFSLRLIFNVYLCFHHVREYEEARLKMNDGESIQRKRVIRSKHRSTKNVILSNSDDCIYICLLKHQLTTYLLIKARYKTIPLTKKY